MAICVVGLSTSAVPALLFFLLGYAAANLAAFAVVVHLRGRTAMLHFGARQYTGHRVFENNSSLASGDFFIKLCRLRGWSATLGQFQYTHDPPMPTMRKRDEIAPPDRCLRPLNSSPVHAYEIGRAHV